MTCEDSRRFPRICSLLDGVEEVMTGVEGITRTMLRITRNCALIGLVLGVLTGTETLHQVAAILGRIGG